MQKGFNSSHKNEMCNTTISIIRNTTFEFLIKNPKSMIELTLRGKFAESPHVIDALDRTPFYP